MAAKITRKPMRPSTPLKGLKLPTPNPRNTIKQKYRDAATTANPITVEARVNAVMTLILEGGRYFDITHLVHQWGLSDRTGAYYAQRARKIIREYAETYRNEGLDHAISQRQEIYRRSMKAKDYRTALLTVIDLAKLFDYYPDEKSLSITVDLNKLTNEQIDRLERGESIRSVLGRLPKQIPSHVLTDEQRQLLESEHATHTADVDGSDS